MLDVINYSPVCAPLLECLFILLFEDTHGTSFGFSLACLGTNSGASAQDERTEENFLFFVFTLEDLLVLLLFSGRINSSASYLH